MDRTELRSCSPFGGIPRNWKRERFRLTSYVLTCSPFGGIPRNWKQFDKVFFESLLANVPPSGGSLEIGNGCPFGLPPNHYTCSPFGGIPRNWKLDGD